MFNLTIKVYGKQELIEKVKKMANNQPHGTVLFYDECGIDAKHPISYAIYQEYGTMRMAAHPFMRPAIWYNEEYIKSVLSDISMGYISSREGLAIIGEVVSKTMKELAPYKTGTLRRMIMFEVFT